jgi:exosome complex component CSL4
VNSRLSEKTGQLVVPGEQLGVIEEFVPDLGTYVKDGVIYSKVLGRALLDLSTRRVSVFPVSRGPKVPKVSSIVVGQVNSVQNENANVRIFRVGKEDVAGFFSGILHISDVQMRYVDSMFDVCKPSDIMRAKVISDKNRVFHLSTQDKDLGVLYAFCTNCGFLLEPRRMNMHCPRCGRIEKRKTAFDYGKGEL